MADIDGDGHIDLLSGSWPGEIFLFRGGSGRTFGAPEMLKDRTGEYINPDGGIQGPRDKRVLTIAGSATLHEEDGRRYVEYHGGRIDLARDQEVSFTGTATSLHVADWDGDGDYDLLIGDIHGNVWLVPNEGTKTAYAFGKERRLAIDGRFVLVPGRDAGPFLADWDGDGLPDLLVGDGEGGVTFFRNTGKPGEPKLEKGVELVKGPENGWEAAEKPQRGVRSKICVADWDGDGRLDLLLGDFNDQQSPHPKLTDAETADHAKLRAELEQTQRNYSSAISRLYSEKPDKPVTESERVILRGALKKLLDRMEELWDRLPSETDTHGWVWLYRRKPAEKP